MKNRAYNTTSALWTFSIALIDGYLLIALRERSANSPYFLQVNNVNLGNCLRWAKKHTLVLVQMTKDQNIQIIYFPAKIDSILDSYDLTRQLKS
jgi:hypothetical protein